MLSETADFEGGGFSTLEADGHLEPRAFERGDMIIFPSHHREAKRGQTQGGARARTPAPPQGAPEASRWLSRQPGGEGSGY